MENFDIDQLGDTGYTGKNVCVCVLDTGIYPHIDFRDRRPEMYAKIVGK